MTFLQLINKVLTELREDNVADISTPYTRLIGQFINEAKADVENAWKWKALRTNKTFSTIIDTSEYAITGTNERCYIMKDRYQRPQVYNTTSNSQYQLGATGLEDYRRKVVYDNNQNNGMPDQVASKKSSTGMTLCLWPVPDAVYPMQATIIIPQDELEAITDILSVPSRPVYLLAARFAAAERTEGMGIDVASLQARADTALKDAIALDQEDDESDFISQ